jgi:Flp pilus assembly protein TadD
MNPRFMEAHGNLGAAHLHCNQIEAAMRELQWALQLRPEEPWLHHTLALAQWKRRDVIAAAGEWCRTIYLYVRPRVYQQNVT